MEGAVRAAGAAVQAWLGSRAPRIAVVLGSGQGAFVERLADPASLPWREIPGFPSAGVAGHRGELVVARAGQTWLLCQSGRVHGYEGFPPDAVALAVRVFAGLGVRSLILTNAAGGIRRGLRPGALLLLADQINLSFRNPLIGPVLPGETRFPDMSGPYDPELRALAREVARAEAIDLEEGVYAGVPGPSYETPAEIRMLDRLGADAVGMSTVAEVVAARANGLRCLGISTITNLAAGLGSARLSHDEVIRASGEAAERLGRLLAGVIARL